jgi:hypothetical protein
MRRATAGVAYCIFRIELDRLIIFADGAVVVALGGVPEPAVVETFRIFRIELDHPIQVADGAVIVTFGRVPGGAEPPPIAASGEALRIEDEPDVPDRRPSPMHGSSVMPRLISAAGRCMFATSAEPEKPIGPVPRMKRDGARSITSAGSSMRSAPTFRSPGSMPAAHGIGWARRPNEFLTHPMMSCRNDEVANLRSFEGN